MGDYCVMRDDERDVQVLAEIGQPRDVGAMVRFLASGAVRFATGAGYIADGGLTAQ